MYSFGEGLKLVWLSVWTAAELSKSGDRWTEGHSDRIGLGFRRIQEWEYGNIGVGQYGMGVW